MSCELHHVLGFILSTPHLLLGCSTETKKNYKRTDRNSDNRAASCIFSNITLLQDQDLSDCCFCFELSTLRRNTTRKSTNVPSSYALLPASHVSTHHEERPQHSSFSVGPTKKLSRKMKRLTLHDRKFVADGLVVRRLPRTDGVSCDLQGAATVLVAAESKACILPDQLRAGSICREREM